ncbi:nuclease [Globomyces sp. JEL0801]|nr:nuclease [Globomyces sp. JEL0801]
MYRPALTFFAGISVGSVVTISLSKYIENRNTKQTTTLESTVQKSTNNSIETVNGSLRFGIPTSISDTLVRDAYILNYNRSLRNPTWVAEHLTADSLNVIDKSIKPDRKLSHFKEDDMIPKMFRAKLADYVGSGLDRGHLAPAADVQSSQKALDETFYLSNMSPQVPIGFNRGYWAYLENFVRTLTTEFQDVFVISGPLYLPTKETDGRYYVKYQMIGEPPNVAVPTHFFKVILTQRNNSYYKAAFVLPNQSIDSQTPLTSFMVPLDSIESSAGIEFFPDIKQHQVLNLCNIVPCQLKNFKNQVSKSLE